VAEQERAHRAQHEINRLSRRIDTAVETLPLTLDFDVGLINAVGVVRRSQVRTNSFLQLRSISLSPAVNRLMIERDAALWLRFLPLLVDLSLDLPELSPSLHGHYPTSSLLRDNPPLFAALVLSASRDFRLRIVANEQSI